MSADANGIIVRPGDLAIAQLQEQVEGVAQGLGFDWAPLEAPAP